MTGSRTSAQSLPREATRERLLDAAAELFYQEGLSTGIQALAKAAGASKRTMYELFASKDDLLTAAVERQISRVLDLVLPAPDDPERPRERILRVFELLEQHAMAAGYLGCPFLSVQVELKDPEHPASRAASEAKAGLHDFFHHEAKRGGAGDPETLARQLVMLYDGAAARAGAAGEQLDGLTLTTASTLMNAAGVSD